MTAKQFFKGLAITSLFQVLICFLLILIFSSFLPHITFISVTISTMLIFSAGLFMVAKMFARSPVLRLYIQLMMIAVFLKMLLCVALIVVYKKGFQVVDNKFLWPFLIIYISSTIYEVIFLEKVGREKHA